MPRRLGFKWKAGTPDEQDSRDSASRDDASGDRTLDTAPPDPAGDSQHGVTRTAYGDVEHVVYSVASSTTADAGTSDTESAGDVAPGAPTPPTASGDSSAPAEPQPEFDRYGNRVHRDPPGTWTIRFDTGGVDVSNERRHDRTEGWDDYDPFA